MFVSLCVPVSSTGRAAQRAAHTKVHYCAHRSISDALAQDVQLRARYHWQLAVAITSAA